MLVIADASQIDCRILNYVAGEDDVIEAFRVGRDIYCEHAADIYRRPITKANEHERFVGKRTELSSGYGFGHKTLQKRLKDEGVTVTPELAEKAIQVYRARHPKVRLMWRESNVMLHWLARKAGRREWLKGIIITEGNALILPNKLKLQYNVHYDDNR